MVDIPVLEAACSVVLKLVHLIMLTDRHYWFGREDSAHTDLNTAVCCRVSDNNVWYTLCCIGHAQLRDVSRVLCTSGEMKVHAHLEHQFD